MAAGTVRDAAGRHFPAHLDTRYGDQHWWHGDVRYSRRQPWYTFDRRRDRRDADRRATGTPPDHQPPRPGDAPEERARARAEAADTARAARWRQETAESVRRAHERWRLGIFDDLGLTCTCPPGCEELLFPDQPLSPAQNAVPHVEDCSCRCDIA